MADGLLNKASIILTPTGYKAGTLYNVAPIEAPYEDFDFARTSTATRINSSGLVSNVATGVPRISYDSNGDNGHILLEPTSTNLITYSEDFTQWSKEATVTLTPNYGISPDGTQNSTRMQMNANDSLYISTSSGLTASFYVKGTLGETIRLSNGSATTHTLTGNWDRVEIYDSSSVSSLISINTYSGATARDIEIWGAQAEALSYATSYIPTLTGSTETRATETATGAGSADLINSTEGVLYAEIALLSENDKSSNNQLFLNDGTSLQRVGFYTDGNGDIKVQLRDVGVINNVTALDQSETGVNVAAFNKIAIQYKSGENKLFVNGSRITDTNFDNMTFDLSTLSELDFGSGANSNYFRGKCKALAVFNEALSDSELTQLTT